MAYLPEFEVDIFISYAHVDNATANPAELGWVELFSEHLRVELDRLTGRSGKAAIWWDKALGKNQVFNQTIQTRLERSALLLVLTSRGHLASEYCQQEVRWFCESVSQQPWGLQIGDRLRLVNVRLQNIHHSQWPPQYQVALCHDFHDVQPAGGFGTPFAPGSAEFKRVLLELRDTLFHTLGHFRAVIDAGAPDSLPVDVALAPLVNFQKWFGIVCVNPPPDSVADWPGALETLRAWTWQNTAEVRWAQIEQQARLPAWLGAAKLLVLNRSPKNSTDAEKYCAEAQRRWPELPVLVINSQASPNLPLRRIVFTRVQTSPTTSRRADLLSEALQESQQLEETLQELQVRWPRPALEFHWPDADQPSAALFRERVSEWLDTEFQLQLAIQKFFPNAQQARLLNDQRGWLVARLLQFSIDEKASYFLKFFEQRDDFEREWDCCAQAENWLGKEVFALQPIEDLADPLEAFPVASPYRYPVCYKTSGAPGAFYLTLKECYRQNSFDFVESAFDRLLETLSDGQPVPEPVNEVPWSTAPGNDFCWPQEMKRCLRETLDELELYGPALYGEQKKWDECHARLRHLGSPSLPQWLTETRPVVRGHVHGNPESRNCLVNSANARDIRLVGCGAYRMAGRLVADLALIEHDLKMSLLNTEAAARGFFDLDVAHVQAWCAMESLAIDEKLAYEPAHAANAPDSVQRAYALIGHLRLRAQKVSADGEGHHYFAALLYWTLYGLHKRRLPPTKQLLALHSASEILRVFGT